jgi:hypothetical protein
MDFSFDWFCLFLSHFDGSATIGFGILSRFLLVQLRFVLLYGLLFISFV